MLLWTIQAEDAVGRFMRTGMLRGDGRHVWRRHRFAYHWFIAQMRARIGPPPPGSAYPICAWKAWRGRAKPDLRACAQLPGGTRDAILLSFFRKPQPLVTQE